ncbi:MAG TPA: RidA family protein [Alphaproteobacteria bacterium]|jgi:enamine deaminase RidA (YjgF/YER057c/UK114 family)
MNAILHPAGWAPPIGYSNGIVSAPGRIVFVAGQIGWNADQRFETSDLAEQFAKALENIVAVLGEAGAKPEHICRMTAYCTGKAEYLAARAGIGRAWRRIIGKHFPAMTMVFVTALLDEGAKIELEATAVVP